MGPSLYPIPLDLPGQLFLMAKPSTEWLAEDIAALGAMGLDGVVSLLTPPEAAELGLTQEDISRKDISAEASAGIPRTSDPRLRACRPLGVWPAGAGEPGRAQRRPLARHPLPGGDRQIGNARLLHPDPAWARRR